MEERTVSERTGRPDGTAAGESVRADVSREMVRLYKDLFGRGPTKVRTEFAGPDIVVCTLENSFTPAERKLVEMNEHQRLRDTRQYFQHATEQQFYEVVERLLRRRVRAFVSGIDTRMDVATEVFYLGDALEAADTRDERGWG